MYRLFITALIAVACSTCCFATDTLPVTSFETATPEVVTATGDAQINVVQQTGVTDGKNALRIDFAVDTSDSGIAIKAKQGWQTQALGDCLLRFDAHNPGDYSVSLTAVVGNEQGNSRRRVVSIPAGSSGSYYFELRSEDLDKDFGLRDDPPAFDIDVIKMPSNNWKYPVNYDTVASIKFTTGPLLHAKSLIIDNVRIESSPPKKPDYLVGIADKFGQSTSVDFAEKVSTDEELRERANEELKELAVSRGLPDRSIWGGWKDGPQLEGTGYFRTQKVDGVWAIVDPDGYLFFSSGIANARMANTSTFTGVDFKDDSVRYIDPEDVTPEDSRGIVSVSDEVRNTRYIINEQRHQLFAELPSYDDELADHYSYRRKTHRGPVPHGETYSFYRANLERRYGETDPGSYLLKWRDVTLDRLIDWGFTSFGNWAAAEFFHAKRVPYFANGWVIGDFKTNKSGFDYWGPLPDPFDPEFVRRAKVTTKVVAEEVLGNPWCIGVFIDNEMGWGMSGPPIKQYGLVFDALSKPEADCPAKSAFMSALKQKHGTIESINQAWATDFKSWEELAAGVDLRQANHPEGLVEDFSMLMEMYATEYFKVVDEALAAVLPNHMYMGARLATWGMTDEVRRAAKKHVDVMSYNYYKEGVGKKGWEFLAEVDMPSIIGEFHMGSTDTGLFNPGLVHAADQKDRGRMWAEYMKSAATNPYIVGAHWFQYIDSPITGRAHDGENYNVGWVTIADVPYEDMVAAAKAFHRELYPMRFGAVTK